MGMSKISTGLFVILEGGDAAGKTSLVIEIINILRRHGIAACRLHWSETGILDYQHRRVVCKLLDSYGNSVRQEKYRLPRDIVSLARIDAAIYNNLYYWGVIPHVSAGGIVVSDGWSYRSFAKHLLMLKQRFEDSFQGCITVQQEKMHHFYEPSFREDAGILVRAKPEECYKRKAGIQTIFEDGFMIGLKGRKFEDFVRFQRLLYSELEIIASQRQWQQIDNNDSLYSTVEECLMFIQNKGNLRRNDNYYLCNTG